MRTSALNDCRGLSVMLPLAWNGTKIGFKKWFLVNLDHMVFASLSAPRGLVINR